MIMGCVEPLDGETQRIAPKLELLRERHFDMHTYLEILGRLKVQPMKGSCSRPLSLVTHKSSLGIVLSDASSAAIARINVQYML